MQADHELSNACLVVRYEEVCSKAQQSLQRVFEHLEFEEASYREIVDAHAPLISAPDYYEPDFSDAEKVLIRKITSDTAAKFGYPIG